MAFKGSYLAVGKLLEPDDYLVSPNGEYVAYLKDNGQLGLCYAVEDVQPPTPDWDRCYWETGAAPGGQPWAYMQSDGNFVLYDGPRDSAPAYWASNTNLNRDFVTALQDDGNLVVCTGTPPGDPEEIVWSALPQISAACKFMQNYRVTVPVNGGPEVLAIKNNAAAIELFTLGTGGDIHTFYPDAQSETGYSEAVLTTGLNASHLAGGTDGEGNVVLFASAGNVVFSLAETSDAASRWGTPQLISAPDYPVTGLVARNLAGKLCLLTMQKGSNGQFQSGALRWGVDAKIHPNVFMTFPSAPPVFLQYAGSPKEPTAAYVTADKILFWGLDSGRAYSAAVTVAGLGSSQLPVGLDIATDGAGTEWIVAAFQDGQVYRLTAAGDQPDDWTPLWPPIAYTDYSVQFSDVVVETDSTGGVHVFAVAKPQAVVEGDPAKYNVLYHRPPTSQAGLAPLPVHKSNGMQLAGVADNAGRIDLFAVEAANLVTHLFAEEDGSNWSTERVLDPADDNAPITEYSSYATDITVYDGNQAVLAQEYVDIYASDRMRIEINGLTFFIEEDSPIHVPTNDAGMLCISTQTGSLASPLLRIALSTARMPDQADQAPMIVVEPYADVHLQLGTATSDELLAAKVTNDDGTTSDLLQGDYRNGATPQSLADALQSFLGDSQHSGELSTAQRTRLAARAKVHMHGHRPPDGDGPGSPGPSRPGRPASVRERDRFWSRQAPHPGGLRQAGALKPGRPCRLTFHENGLEFEPLTAAQAAELREQKLATLPAVSASGIGSWWTKIGDALQAVVDGIVNVGHVIYDGLTATLDLIIDGITYVFDAVVEFVEDAFDMAEMIFAHVKVFFEQLYKWLAWLFDWTSIKQTQACVVYSFNQMLLFLKNAVAQLRPMVDNGFSNFTDQFGAMMDDAIGNIAGPYSIGGYDQRNASYDADADSATANNFFFNEFIVNGAGSGPQAPPQALTLGSSDPVSTLAALLTDLTTVEEASGDAFNQAMNYFTELGKNPDQIFNMALGGMLSVLKGIGQVGLELAGKIVDALLDALADVIDMFASMVAQKVSIPFVSAFYKWITKGDDLTLLNLVSLATAIPSAILYRITVGDPLFTSTSGPGSAEEFTNAFDYTMMLAAAGLAPPSARAGSGPIPAITKKVSYGMAGAYLTVTWLGGLLSGIAEVPMPQWRYPLGWIPWAGLTCSFLSAVFSFSWFYADQGGIPFEDKVYMAMCFSLVLMVYFDTCGSYAFSADTVNDVRAMAFTVSGALLLAQAAWNTKDDPDGRVPAWMIIQRIPWALKFLRLNAISSATGGVSVLVLVFVDHACGLTSGVLGYRVLRDRYDVAAARSGIEASPA